MQATYLVLTDAFLDDVRTQGCPDALVQFMRKALSEQPTRGERLGSIHDDPARLPGGGYYVNTFPHGQVTFAVLHLFGDRHRDGYLLGLKRVDAGVADFLSRTSRERLQSIARALYGPPPLDE